jgi:flagellar hook-associated protein 1 FlgK
LSEFWNAWEDLSANPSGQAERLTLVSVSQSLTSLFRSYGDDLLSAQNDANARIATLVEEVNGYISDIADINENIMRCGSDVSDDSEINNLKDTRENLLTSLAGIVDFHYTTNEDSSISIFLSNGIPLVDGSQSWSLDVVGSGQTAFCDVVFADDPSASINDYLTKGSLAACIELRDTMVAGYIDSLNALAASVVDQVNSQHGLGYDMNQDAGGDFFFFDIDPEVEDARYMKVSTEITDDISKIAASSTVNGDGDNAASIGAIKDELVMNGGTSTLSAYYSSIVGQVGQDAAYANRNFEHNTDLMTQLTNKREGVSGVSIDEEMLNLIKYQTGYNASAKLFTLTEELIDTLIGLVE